MLDPFRQPILTQYSDEWRSFFFSRDEPETPNLSISARWAREMTYPRTYLHEIDLSIVGEFPQDREELEITIDFRLPSFLSAVYPNEAGIVVQRFGGSYGPLKFVTETKGVGEGNMGIVLLNEYRVELGVLWLPVTVHSSLLPEEEKL